MTAKIVFRFQAIVSGIVLLAFSQSGFAQSSATVGQGSAQQVIEGVPRESASLFISGHSLIDQPIPDYLAEIAGSLGTPLQWNRQYVVGSSIRVRIRGRTSETEGWQGYRSGYNRSGEGLDVIAELRNPETVPGNRYDALVITEQHAVLSSLMWNDTVRYLRHYHERLIDGNPAATTYFYESWLSIQDKSNPQRWIAYERAASPIWQCIATRVNVSLAAEGRSDRILSLPMGLAMAELVERATSPAGLPGVSRGSVRETVDGIMSDNVHNTNLGKYYAALVTYAFVYRRTPEKAWYPKTLNQQQAKLLQQLAWQFTADYVENNVPLSLWQCQERMRTSFINLYWGYTRDTYWKKELGNVRAYFRWLRYVLTWHVLMLRNSRENPFSFDAATDRSFWLRSP